MSKEKIIFTWSGGKDSALALYKLKQNKNYEVVALLTTVTKDYKRISMHGVPENLLKAQAKSLALPLEIVYISKDSSCKQYEDSMKQALLAYKKKGALKVAFGDIFLQDIKKYRVKQLAKLNMQAIFPLWKQNTHNLAKQFIDLGFKATIVCVDTTMLDKRFCGREYSRRLLADLPKEVDPCSENGESHSFIYDGPIFKEPILFKKGKKVLRDNRFYYCDLVKV